MRKRKRIKGKVGKRKRGEKRHFISARPTPGPLAAAMAAAATTTGEKKKKSPSPRGPSFVVRGKCGICPNKIPQKMFFSLKTCGRASSKTKFHQATAFIYKSGEFCLLRYTRETERGHQKGDGAKKKPFSRRIKIFSLLEVP